MIVILVTVIIQNQAVISQNAKYNFPDTLNKKRLNGLIIGGSIAYVATMTGLYYLWYNDYPMGGFHFYNDIDQWMVLDKLGHMTTSYQIGRLGYLATRWTGIKENKSIWIGGSLGLIFLTTVEVFDGFSEGWGASPWDLIANTAGAALFISQQLGWKEQRIMLKFSYHPTKYAQYNPEVLGKNIFHQAIKDYNGHTYWLSGNIKSFLKKSSKFPKWLNISFGYSAKGMTGAFYNPTEVDEQPIPSFARVSQFFISPDIDLTRIKTNSKFLKAFFEIIGILKFPFPTVEYNKEDNIKFHWIYF